jgi:hypothetical protein
MLWWLIVACQTEPEALEGDASTDGTYESPPLIEVDCTAACARTTGDAGAARCYACRCKAAMDGWLPPPEALQCSLGDPIEVFTADGDGALTRLDAAAPDCANPSLLYGTCAPGGRLGQLTHGDVTVKWICRRNGPTRDPGAPYDDVGAIVYNARTGASCWFDDRDQTGLADDNWPEMDLTKPDADAQGWVDLFHRTEGDGCVGCHDNDPFLYTPFLRSVPWVDGPWAFGAFHLVRTDGTSSPTGGRHLVSPEAQGCTACHRIASNQTCAAWAPDALGTEKRPGHQDLVVEAAGDLEHPLWQLGTWMPTEAVGADAWRDTFGAAAAVVADCCWDPGVDRPAQGGRPACVWADVP